MKIWNSPYKLSGGREGALLKVEWQPGHFGFSDLHPWPEFGDAPLADQLDLIAMGKPAPLGTRSLELSFVDHEYRMKSRSAFAGLDLPMTHFLVEDILLTQKSDLVGLVDRGFSHVKVKMGSQWMSELQRWQELSGVTKLTWRLDFNQRVKWQKVKEWWEKVDPELQQLIDFVEDPILPGEESLIDFSGPWAADWTQIPTAIRILKPARENFELARPQDFDSGLSGRIVFTHALDHPLGQASALWSAAQCYRHYPRQREVCGLGTSKRIQVADFSEQWRCDGPTMKAPHGFGFGFDDVLRAQKWESLR